MLNKYKTTIILLITLIITSTSIKLKTKFIPLAEGTPISEDEISETLSSLALKRIYNRLPQIHFSSCALSAKFILSNKYSIQTNFSIFFISERYIDIIPFNLSPPFIFV